MIDKSEKVKLRATLKSMKKARQRGNTKDAKNDKNKDDNVLKPEQKERSFRQQEEFGAKKRIKP